MTAHQKVSRQYKPVLSKREAARVPRRQRKAVDAICRKSKMPEADVLRYGLEAVLLGVSGGVLSLQQVRADETYDEMVSIRLSKDLRPFVDKLKSQRRHLPTRADVFRACLDTMIAQAEKHGFAWLVALREKFI